MFSVCVFSFPSHVLSSPFFSRSLPFVTQIRGHMYRRHILRPPLPRCLPAPLSREEFIQYFLPSSTRAKPCMRTHSTRRCLLVVVVNSSIVADAPLLSFSHRSAPRWLGRLSWCLPKSISRVQFSPSAHTRRDFFLHKNLMSGKRESVS